MRWRAEVDLRYAADPLVRRRGLPGETEPSAGLGPHARQAAGRPLAPRLRRRVREDGFRTIAVNDDPNVFEWWYSDFTGEDGTVVSHTLQTRVDDGFVPEPG
ncbi:hypothetical protein [Streptomyces sp. NRRL S-813]|uniref:hypothetical protein n=1 Tax=Streptomyces sp. NRRL S-813 TaxID=1463919 RepID=UPI0004BEF566|nr:hypothetical protein [Streptomyces sp. NRRL S-813]